MLDSRLQLVASFVKYDSRVADIGTDHALLPIELIKSGICQSAIACDLRQGPLQNAHRSIHRMGLEDKIFCRLGNGLQPVQKDEVDTIVIAGMGGDTIVSILKDCSWIKNSSIQLIIQPMSKSELIRKYLWDNGFSIDKEKTTKDWKHIYSCFTAVYDDKQEPFEYTEIDTYCGLIGQKDATDTDVLYLKKVLDAFKKKHLGLSKKNKLSDFDQQEIQKLDMWIQELETKIQNMEKQL